MIENSRKSARVLGSAIAAAVAITLTCGAGAQTPQQDEPRMPQQTHQDPMQQDPMQQEQMEQVPMQQEQMQPGQARESGTPATATSAIVVGEVLDMRDVRIRGPIEETHRVIKVETRKGATTLVDIGNAQHHSDVNFVKGDRIVAVGKKGRLDDRPILFAKTVGELYSVGRHTVQSAGLTSERSGGPTSPTQTPPARGDEVPQVSLYYFQTDNLQTDRYGTYDEDFAWETDEQWYGNWSGADASGDQYSATDEDIYIYSDSETDDWGVWDW